ncbi:MAG: PD40 domain-containing protein [Armatimonadetes bacterium]|nr:PD40 domain-containing protein [Anaerolineae bacterium]
MPDPKHRLLLDDDDAFVDQEPPPPTVIDALPPKSRIFDDPLPPRPRRRWGRWGLLSLVLVLGSWQAQHFFVRPLTLFYQLMTAGDRYADYTAYNPTPTASSPMLPSNLTLVRTLSPEIPGRELPADLRRFLAPTPTVGAPNTIARDWLAGSIVWDTAQLVPTCDNDQVIANERIVYLDRPTASSSTDGSTMFITSPNRIDRCQLSPLNAIVGDTTVRWSPDGTHIAFSMKVEGLTQVYMMTQGDRAPTLLTADCERSVQPDWSPNGDYIVFSGTCARADGIYYYKIRTKQVVQLTTEGRYPRWSPDGASIFYSVPQTTGYGNAAQTTVYQLAVTPADNGSGLRMFVLDHSIEWDGFAYNGATDQLIYSARVNLTPSRTYSEQIYAKSLSFTNSSELLVSRPASYSQLDWLPGRGRIAFLAQYNADQKRGLYSVNADGEDLQRHLNAVDIAAFDWYSAAE